MKINKKILHKVVRLRVSNHNLRIEEGRYENKKQNIQRTPEEERLCKICNSNQIEDEKHFLCQCIIYDNIRTPLFDEIQEKNKNFKNSDINRQMIILLSQLNKDEKLLTKTIKFIYECFHIRDVKLTINSMIDHIGKH